ncbi:MULTISPECIES: hypothetical protein [Legionella]|uniref:Uncharacterized protein n=1 Tax=Legionella resiliens TaxID=2905958 RepID=A0ABS8X3F0_9GAMM|nr:MULTISPECIES: hypothetical protein [unclassified Legionella]MCE0722959.1 hypothetical protein [Legionella sp. 9fVS26]MCE3532112.1 hypothetical protein [Legionella sp. 8cVS16]QLZ68240.1 hypothetical protein FOLKNPGA_01018 [Legionella sp. PC1000]
MPLIVNLSAIHALKPISTCVRAFEDICDRYSTGYFSCCSSFFQSWTNYAWLMYQLGRNDSKLIQPYRLGKLTTEQFLERLLKIFSFLEDATPEEGEMEELKGKQLYSNTFARMLLENAWNSQVEWDESKADYLSALIHEAEGSDLNAEVSQAVESKPKRDPIYFIANTNELHVLQILNMLRKAYPSIKFYRNIDLSIKEDKEPVEIAPGIFLCLSYRYQLFKTQEENQTVDPSSTMSLLNYLVTKQFTDVPVSELRVISQHQEDLVEALRVGIDADHIYQAKDYFAVQTANIKKMS